MTVQPGGAAQVLTVSVFVLSAPDLGAPGVSKIVFQQLVGMTSEIDPPQNLATAPGGTAVIHTKQLGQTVPPIVTLKRGMDGDKSLWQWHQLALNGDPAALKAAVLQMYDAGGFAAGKPPLSTWELTNAWCAKIALAGAEAGAGGAVFETVDIVCDRIAPA
ncbi:phage tail-like protein [Catenulispora sp. GP43]|uniref:phage tail protein n=1 Tax=Catenulispora sp. GP43 TaxID=3156263 RepID=UPI003514AE1C